jgi:prepilin-type N-terminal cleavage/methylation domain-containing protein
VKTAPRARRGFTLVEMLTVIAIIVLLAGMLLPAIAEAQRKVYQYASRSQIRSIETALNAFKQDWREYPNSNVPGNFGDGGAVLYTAICRTFTVGGGPAYGPYYARSDDELSTSINPAWVSTLAVTPLPGVIPASAANTTPYILDRIPPGMPVLYWKSFPGRPSGLNVMLWEDCALSLVRPTTQLQNHTSPSVGNPPAPGSPWALPSPSPNGRQNFYLGRVSRANEAGTVWAEYPRWGVMGPEAGDGTTFNVNPNARPSREGSFMLVSPGLDRKYGTHDDVRNYETY